ncbi:MAG: hypothetical protein QM478_04530 [Flavobacteriaceae bacterium]
MKKIIRIITILVLVAFALLTLFLSSSVIFDWFGIREREGNYVLVVVWANFISSLLYLFSAYGIIKQKKWAIKPLIISAIVLIIVGTLFYFHINSGGIHETKTIGALTFRTVITLVFIFLTYLTTIKWKQS